MPQRQRQSPAPQAKKYKNQYSKERFLFEKSYPATQKAVFFSRLRRAISGQVFRVNSLYSYDFNSRFLMPFILWFFAKGFLLKLRGCAYAATVETVMVQVISL
tara:strand:- start:205 stop:513 length:309 start_codon:yes stop_codon:yes gene_type:complete